MRLNIRVTEQQKDLITRAAVALNTTVSSFVLQKAYAEAQAVLRDQSQFRLSGEKWREFCRAFGAATKDIPAVWKLLTESVVFDGS